MAKDGNMAAAMPAAPNKGLFVIIIAVVVAVAIGAGAAMFLSGGKKKHKKAEMDDDDSVPVPTVVFKDEFIVNLISADGAGGHFMRVPKVELEVGSESVTAKVEANRSKIADRISSTLRGKTVEDMLKPGSDKQLKDELKKVINETRSKDGDYKGVKEVILPGSFIVQ